MADQADQEFLRSIFLMEAWDTLVALEEAVSALESGAAEDAEPLFVVTHRLRGAASLHGFPGVAELAGALERSVARVTGATAEPRAGLPRLQALLATLKRALDTIAPTGLEPAGLADAPAPPAPPAPASPAPPDPVEPRRPSAPSRASSPPPAAPSAVPSADPLRAELESFFAANADVLTYFGPEAAEHLDGMTASLLALERDGASREELGRLFRAAHTLKGAAYVVGCPRVGEVAHRMEDLLVRLREERRPVTPPMTEALLAGVDAVRLMLAPADKPDASLTDTVAVVLARVSALVDAPAEEA